MIDLSRVDWSWGGMMAAVGMSVVFGLLAVLWLLLVVIGRLDAVAERRAAAAEAPPASTPDASGDTVAALPAAEPAWLDDDTMAAITVAVIKHADIRRKQAAPEMRASAPGSQLWASRWVAVGRGSQNAPWRRR